MSYVVKGDALHGFVLPQGVHLIQVSVRDEQSPVLCLVKTVDLGNTKLLVSHPQEMHHELANRLTSTPWREIMLSRRGFYSCAHMLRKVRTNDFTAFYLSHVAGEQNSHELVFPLQLAGNESE